MNLGRKMSCSKLFPGRQACGWLLATVLCAGAANVQAATASGAAKPKTAPVAQFTLRIDGAISAPDGSQAMQLDLEALKALPQRTVTTRTPWHDGVMTFGGPRLSDLLEPFKPQGKTLRLTALNDYSIDIPLSDLQRYQPVLAWQLNGKALSVRDKGPLFLIYPFDSHPELQNQIYYGRSIWQVKTISIQ